jgi:BolA protein
VTAARHATIRNRLEAAFEPDELDLVDDSPRHAGHMGARDGRGHFQVRIVSRQFANKRPLERHRLVYAALGTLMQTDIHALAVTALTPEEAKSSKP